MTETSDEGTKELLRIVNALQEKSDDTEVMNQENWLNHLKNSDEGWGELIHLLESGAKEGKVKIKGIKGCVLVEDYVIIGQTLRNAENPECNRKVVPESARSTLVTEMHEGCLGGHFSAKKMLRQLSKRFFWPKMIVTMEKCVKGCPKCICTNDHPKLTAPLKPYETSRPLEIVAVDLIDVGLSVQGNRYILSIIDLFTKYGAAIPIPDNKAETVVKAFIDRWALGEGRIPEVLLSDQGKEFVNSHFEQLVKMLNIKHITTKGYNSRTNGCVERFNKTIMQILKKKTAVPMEWDEQIPFAVFAYNSVAHKTTGESPMFLMYGRDSKHPIHMEGEDAVGMDYSDADEYKHILVQELLKAHRRAKEHAEREWEENKKLLDQKYKTENRKYPTVGSRVLIEIPTERIGARCPKLVNKWKGPYRVVKCTQNSATVIPILGGKEEFVIPFDNLRVISVEMENVPIVTNKGRQKQKVPMWEKEDECVSE
uniref:RNA-directed DNA polymerase n=1 Tax=Caenorhabditis japonica TaxID=281687 RepID=A0A8R1DIR6_CAEJA